MCTVGGYGLYLLERFEQTHEMSPPPDFTNNGSWFDMKILIDVDSSSVGTRKEIESRSYATLIRNICNKLGIPSNKLLHFGRKCSPKLLELYKVEDSMINKLANWGQDTLKKAYSANMPFQPMRVMAGFSKAEGRHFNPRTTVEPPEELQNLIAAWNKC